MARSYDASRESGRESCTRCLRAGVPCQVSAPKRFRSRHSTPRRPPAASAPNPSPTSDSGAPATVGAGVPSEMVPPQSGDDRLQAPVEYRGLGISFLCYVDIPLFKSSLFQISTVHGAVSILVLGRRLSTTWSTVAELQMRSACVVISQHQVECPLKHQLFYSTGLLWRSNTEQHRRGQGRG